MNVIYITYIQSLNIDTKHRFDKDILFRFLQKQNAYHAPLPYFLKCATSKSKKKVTISES